MNAADVTESSNLGLIYIRLLTADKSAKGTMVCCNISMCSDATWLEGKDAYMQRVARSVSSVCTASTVIFPRQLQPYHVAGRLCATAVIWLYACAFGYDIHIPKKYENRRVSASAETGKSNMTLALTLLMCHSV